MLWKKYLVGPLLLGIGFFLGHYTAELSPKETVPPVAEFREAFQGGDWIERSLVLSAYAKNLNPDNLSPALEVIESRRRWLSQDELRIFMSAWSRFDPQGAFEKALSWPDHTRNKGAAAAIYGWALVDPEGAQRAIQTVSDSMLAALLLDRMVAAWAHGNDREGVTAYIGSLPDGPVRDRLTNVLIREILAEGDGAVADWAQNLPEQTDNDFKSTAFEKASGVLAQNDYSSAVALVEKNLDAEWAQGGLAAVARRWVAKDSKAAMEWVRNLPEVPGRNRAMQVGFVEWQKKSPVAAENWLASMDQVPAVDPAIAIVVRQLAVTSPPEAIELLETMADPSLRREALIFSLVQWRSMNADEADGWISRNPLSEDVASGIANAESRRRKGRGLKRDG